jgi:CheY-like chemotaxis protein
LNAPPARRVLIVEDEALVAMLLEDMLLDLGHHVVGTAGTLESAEKIIEAGGFEVAILDVNLNGTHTYPLATLLKSKGVHFIFATGYGRAGVGPGWNDAPVLQKPFQTSQLAFILNALE